MLPLSHKLPLLGLSPLLLAILGCAQPARIQRRSVSDLYSDAVQVSGNHAKPISAMPGARRRGGGFLAGGTIETEIDATGSTDTQPTRSVTKTPQNTDGRPIDSSPIPSGSTRHHISDVSQDVDNTVQVDSPWLASLKAKVGISPASSNSLVLANPMVAGPAEEIPLQGESSERISEFFEETELREAIDILAGMTGDKVIVDEAVGGIVTAQIDNATFPEALEQLLLQQGLVYSMHNGAYIIAPPSPDSPLFSYIAERSQYSPQSHLPSKLVELLPQRYRDYYQTSDERNLIVIDAPRQIGQDILVRLQELDSPVQQVVLEAIVCVTLPDSGFRFGMDWNHVLNIDTGDQLNVGMSGLALSAAGSPYGLNNAFDDFAITSAFVQALSQEGYVSIRAQPRVTAKDGEKASISIARETFFSLQPANSSVLFRQDVQKVDAGISLDITPRIRGDTISVSIERAEVSEDIRSNSSNPELTNNPYPIINRRLVSTEVDVRDGHTIVIGGLVQRQTVDRINKVPFLSAIPLLGRLFQTVEKQEQDAEVAIFISPRIVTQE